MATKQILDLQLRSDADATCSVPVDDSTQTWRVTLAQIKSYILAAGNIVASMLATDSVETAKIKDANVTRPKLAAGAVPKISLTASKTSAYTASVDDDLVPCSASGGAFTVTLYAASGNAGRVLTVKKTDSSANAVTVDGNSAETIDGATTFVLTDQYQSVTLACDGTGWHVI